MPGFLLSKTLLAAHFAKRSYSDLLENKEDILLSNKRTDAQVFMTTNVPLIQDQHTPKFDMVISFRGTSSKRDAVTDVDIRRIKCPDILGDVVKKPDNKMNHHPNPLSDIHCTFPPFASTTAHTPVHTNFSKLRPLVHKGFYMQYMSVRKELFRFVDHNAPMVNSHDSQTDTTVITHKDAQQINILIASHSLGGALGTIAALDLAIHRPHMNVHNVTFGSPRVGNKDFVRIYNAFVPNTIRCVHGRDVVTKVPIPLRFKHVDTCKRIPRVKHYAWWDLRRFSPKTLLDDHNMDNYTEGIERETRQRNTKQT
jgi:hypothetical protein